MEKDLRRLEVKSFTTYRGEELRDFPLTYQVAGSALGTAPIVLVCHALTGNSSVAGETGWWGDLIGEGRAIDTRHYTILAFDIPGNGYGTPPLDDPELLSLEDVAKLWLLGLDHLGVTRLDSIIGASLGGALTWQLAFLRPELAERIFPIATDFRASDWLLAQTRVQELLLAHSPTPIHDARIHAMLTYRTPLSLIRRFGGRRTDDGREYKVLDWLDYHGRTLEGRFSEGAYRTMTFLTGNIRVAESASELARIRSEIHLVMIDSDLLFPLFVAEETAAQLREAGKRCSLELIRSEHGHDAFLMEYDQLVRIISPYFAH